ncbi:MAG: T9SS type A sorting domain-containing protein [Bacteroidia bacterium]
MKNNKTMFTKFIIVFTITFFAIQTKAQNTSIYGNYIKNYRVNYNGEVNNYDVVLYFKNTDIVPDSVTFMAGARLITGVNPYKYGISSKTNLCNNMVKVIYKTDNWDGYPSIVASARNENIKYKGKNVPDSIAFVARLDLNLVNIGGFVDNSSYFKDIPLVTIEKGKSNVINLFERDDSYDSLVFNFYSWYPVYPEIKLNSQTGDIYIPNTLDTGFYSVQLSVRDYYVNHDWLMSYPLSRTYFDFTLHVVNEKLPYFIHSTTAKIDNNGIYFKYVPKTENKVNYQADFINPKGLGNYSVNVSSIKAFNTLPTIITTKINDTLLHVDITADLDYNFRPDTNYLGIVKEIPNSFSIIVTTKDSTGNCTQDLTSFYLTNNPTNSIDEATTKNKISIFPNPATTKLTVTSETAIKEIYIYDLLGKLVKQMKVENTKTKGTEIAIDDLSASIYIIQVIDVYDAKLSTKFIKE